MIPPLIFLFLFLSDVRRYYMSITSIMIVSNIIVLVSQNIIFYAYESWCQWENSSKCLPQAPSPLPGFLVVLQERLDQPSGGEQNVSRLLHFRKYCIFEENTIFSFSALLVGIDIFVLFICFYGVFYYSSAIMELSMKSCCCFLGFRGN